MHQKRTRRNLRTMLYAWMIASLLWLLFYVTVKGTFALYTEYVKGFKYGLSWGINVHDGFILFYSMCILSNVLRLIPINRDVYHSLVTCLFLFYLYGWSISFHTYPYRALYLIAVGMILYASHFILVNNMYKNKIR